MKRSFFSFIFFLLIVHPLITFSQGTNFDIGTLPKEWTALTKTKNGLIIYNTCDGGNTLISIVGDKSYEILLHGQQEDYGFVIESVNKNKDNLITIKTKDKDTGELEIFHFKWIDKNKGLGTWTYSFATNLIFVHAGKEKYYPKVNEDCTHFWD